MRKSELSEQDIRTKFITPAIIDAGWDRDRQLRNMVYFANYKIIEQADMIMYRNVRKYSTSRLFTV